MTRVVLLGGTTEASLLARRFVEERIDAVFSYAGRTATPIEQPLPTRIGGFGGVAGLRDFLRDGEFTHVVDATHPFAAGMSQNAVEACAAEGIPLIAFERPPWQEHEGDLWIRVADIPSAVDALPEPPARVFLAIGKQNLAAFSQKPAHHYLLRLVDPPLSQPLPDCEVLIARGPFSLAGDLELIRRNAITHIVAKNGGGSGARAKLDAARILGLPVILIDRPRLPARQVGHEVEDVLRWIRHSADLGV